MPAPANSSFSPLKALRAALLATAIGFVQGAAAQGTLASPIDEPINILLSKLPPRSSDAYRTLEAAADGAMGQNLDMTKSEMWAVPARRMAALRAAAAAVGAEVMELGSDWNRAMIASQDGRAMTAAQSAMMQDAMRQKGAMGMHMLELPDARMMEFALTKGMDEGAAAASAATLVLPLSDTLTVTAGRTSIEKTQDGYVWRGKIIDTEEPLTLMWWPSGRLTGQITYRGHMYAVKNIGGAMHGVIEMSPDSMPPDHAPMGPALQKKMNMREDPLVKMGDASMLRPPAASKRPERGDTRNLEDAPLTNEAEPGRRGEPITAPPHNDQLIDPSSKIEITLLVAYTAKAAGHYTDIGKDLIDLAVADTNASFRDSGIANVSLKLVDTYQTGYVEQGSHFDHVFRFADAGDGQMEEVQALRDTYKADVAVLIVDDDNGCGLAAGVAPPPERAFAVVHHGCAAMTYSLAHEVGHLLGARHDLELDDSRDPFPFGHGFVQGREWRTMMSYKESCDGCPRLPIWSNPNIRVRDVPAGNELANNARVIALEAAKVAAYR